MLRSAKGYQLLKLESTSTAELMPFDKARDQISERVFTGKRNEEFQKYLDNFATSRSSVENPDEKKAYDEGLKLPAKTQ
jgi:hypothetical protein